MYFWFIRNLAMPHVASYIIASSLLCYFIIRSIWFVIYWLERVVGTYKLIVHSFVILLSFLVDLIDFIHGVQLSIYVLLIPAISVHWIDLGTVGFLTWNDLQADILLHGKTLGWCTILKDIQCFICNWYLYYVDVTRLIYFSKKGVELHSYMHK